MTFRAWAFVYTVFMIGILITLVALTSFGKTEPNWGAFAVLVVLATATQLYEAEGTFRNTYYPHYVFFVAAAILLHPVLFIVIVAVPHLAEWLIKRLKNDKNLRAWYIQPFNIATHIIAGYASYLFFLTAEGIPNFFETPIHVVAIALMALLYTLINHVLVGTALFLARGISFKQSGVLTIESLLPEIVLGCLGYVMVVLWKNDPWLIIPALSTLILMAEALKIPQLKQDAQTDAKTGLLNAKYFNKLFTAELEQAQRYRRPLSLILADLDYMRNINNNYGHLAGDSVLAEIGQIMRLSIPDENTAGRFGGEEFVVVLPGVSQEAAREIAERLRQATETASFTINNQAEPIQATMSIGVATFPYNGNDVTELTQAADGAVYHAKRTGRNRVVVASEVPDWVFAEEAAQRKAENPAIVTAGRSNVQSWLENQPASFPTKFYGETEMRTAFEQGQFELHYQPKVELTTGRIAGMEALLRWKHPEQGYIPPTDFIPVAEENGFIYQLGLWVIEQSIRDINLWYALPGFLNSAASPPVISINLSPLQVRQPKLVEEIAGLLAGSRVDPSWLQLEITENLLLNCSKETLHVLNQLKNLGLKLAIDDFGTGYSSLSYLKDLPLDTLKIDRSFVTNLENNSRSHAIIQAIIQLGHNLKLNVVAEGVENAEELLQLQRLSCDFAQGYYFARPLPPAELARLLQANPFQLAKEVKAVSPLASKN